MHVYMQFTLLKPFKSVTTIHSYVIIYVLAIAAILDVIVYTHRIFRN